MPTFGSLFAGIGGIDLGLERAGWECRFQVEWDEFCQRVLAKHWPDVPRYGDITEVNWSGIEPVDLLAGGFPCQPFSVAGKQRRLEDDRWLWPEFARAIRELRPRFVLVENVPGLLVGGGMDAVLGDLAELGYDAEWESIPAAAVGAPHLRYRVWIIGYRRAMGDANGTPPQGGSLSGRVHSQHADADGPGGIADVADAERDGRGRRTTRPREAEGWGSRGPAERRGQDVADTTGGRQPRPRQPLHALDPEAAATWEAAQPVDGGISHQWSVEPDVGRVANGVPARVDRLRSLGNAVVPQVVEVIGRRLIHAIEVAE